MTLGISYANNAVFGGWCQVPRSQGLELRLWLLHRGTRGETKGPPLLLRWYSHGETESKCSGFRAGGEIIHSNLVPVPLPAPKYLHAPQLKSRSDRDFRDINMLFETHTIIISHHPHASIRFSSVPFGLDSSLLSVVSLFDALPLPFRSAADR